MNIINFQEYRSPRRQILKKHQAVKERLQKQNVQADETIIALGFGDKDFVVRVLCNTGVFGKAKD